MRAYLASAYLTAVYLVAARRGQGWRHREPAATARAEQRVAPPAAHVTVPPPPRVQDLELGLVSLKGPGVPTQNRAGREP